MISGIYKIADTVIEIRSQYSDVHTLCRDYITEELPTLIIATMPADIAAERERSAEEDKLQGITTPVTDGYLETLAVYRKITEAMLCKDVLLFHGSVIAVDGVGYLFTAKSGTGKSTHTRLWRKKFGSRAVMINDDKPLLQIRQDGVYVYGTPWDGKHRLSSNTVVPLKAICILTRAETNSIAPVSLHDALPMLMQQCYKPDNTEDMLRTMELVGKTGSLVGLYRLGCNMSPEAADVAYAGMCGEK